MAAVGGGVCGGLGLVLVAWLLGAGVGVSLADEVKKAGGLRLAVEGRPAVVIGYEPGDRPASRHAARELSDHLGKVIGAEFELLEASKVDAARPAILVGAAADGALAELGVDLRALGDEGVVIRTLGNRLLVSGGGPRGVLYAVYGFLEDQIGFEWFTPDAGFVPKKKDLEIPALDIRYRPPLMYRDPYFHSFVDHPEFAVKRRRNGRVLGHKPMPEELGGDLEIIGFVHTFNLLIPPATYFETHPEWFSEIKGRRTAVNAQLCLSNGELRKEATARTLELLRKHPESRIISVSQNDNIGKCECTGCQEIERKLGGASGLMLDFVNGIAAEVARVRPDAFVETLAYQYTRAAPEGIVPADNVMIRLCSIEADSSHELDSPRNEAFMDDLRDWGKISKQLFIWDYSVDFLDAVRLHPNLFPLSKNIPLFPKMGAAGVFEQGFENTRQFTDFIALKGWLSSQLLWDPERDAGALIDRFLTGYYGAAAPHLMDYLRLLDRTVRARGKVPGYGDPDLSGFDGKVLAEAGRCFEAALKAVEADPELQRRVRIEEFAYRYLKVLRYLEGVPGADGQELFPSEEDAAAECDAFLRDAVAAGIDPEWRMTPDRSLRELLEWRRGQCMPPRGRPPEACKGLERKAWVDIQEGLMTLHGGQDELAAVVEDGAASNGMAVRVKPGSAKWVVQAKPPLRGKTRKLDCHLVVRMDAPEPAGEAFRCGIYDRRNNRSVMEKAVSFTELEGAGYHTIPLGGHTLGPDHFFWLAPTGKAAPSNAILVDRIYLVDVP